MRILLLPIALIHHIILTIRHKLYDWHILKSWRFDEPLICVGNLNLGGTGKSPHTEYLARLLKNEFSVAILSRGYGRKTKGFKRVDATCTYEDVGDEPLQYFRKFPDVRIGVDEDRVEGVEKILSGLGINKVILLDDAFQHRHIRPGFNILLTEYEHLYTKDFLFPAGTLRDLKSAAKRADFIVVSKSPKDLDENKKKEIITQLKPQPEQTVFFSYLEYNDLQPLNAVAESFDAKNADSALLFCGIAHPKPLIDKLKQQYKHLEVMTFADHHAFTENDVQSILERFAQLESEKKIIITTEKDAARLTNSPYLCQFETAPVYDLPVMVRFNDEAKFNEEILDYVRQNQNHN